MGYRTLAEVKQTVSASAKQAQTPPHRFVPMFLPTWVSPDAREKGAMEITTRQKFLQTSIPLWLDFVTYKPIAIMLALGALATFNWNIYVCALLATGAGYYYGGYVWRFFFIDKFLKKRWLYEGT